MRKVIFATSLFFSSVQANAQDALAIFDGVWNSIEPPGYQIVFSKIAGGLRQANLPVLGAATVVVSDGRDASNLKVSGTGFDCFFLFAPVGADEMTWTLKNGPSSCPPTARFRKTPIDPTEPCQLNDVTQSRLADIGKVIQASEGKRDRLAKFNTVKREFAKYQQEELQQYNANLRLMGCDALVLDPVPQSREDIVKVVRSAVEKLEKLAYSGNAKINGIDPYKMLIMAYGFDNSLVWLEGACIPDAYLYPDRSTYKDKRRDSDCLNEYGRYPPWPPR